MTWSGIPEVEWVFSREAREERWNQVETRLGYRFDDGYHRDWAMKSAAWVNEAAQQGYPGHHANLQLAWWGDAIIKLLATQRILTRDFLTAPGTATMQRQDLVSNLVLARAGIDIGLGPLMLLTKGERGSNWQGGGWLRLTANTVEALFGAIWIDVVDDEWDRGEALRVVSAVYDTLVPPGSVE